MRLTRLRELGQEPAVTIGGRTLSYAELRGAAGALAAQLRHRHRVAIWAEPTLNTVIATVAALETGIEAVPLNPKLGTAELAHIVVDCAPDAIVGGPGPGALAGVPRIEVSLEASAELSAEPSDPEQVALIVYTSGTTGPPKGVLLPRRAIATNLDALADAWGWTEDDRLTHALPLFHVHGLVLGILGPLRRGGHVHHLGRFSLEAVSTALGDATMLFAVPTMYHRLADAAERDPQLANSLARPRLLVSGSAPLPARTFGRIERCTGQRIVERYGLSETIMNTAVRADGERRAGEVGRALPGVEVRLIGEDGSDVPRDGNAIGEIVVRGPNLFLGYLNRPEATAQAVRAGWFWTGDLATRAADGYVRIVGRKSTDLIKTGGYKVGAGEVEAALLEHPAVAEAAVRGGPDDDLGERILAWVVLSDGETPPGREELADHVGSLLAPHKRPREIRFVDELPRNAMGKVIKTGLTSEQPPR